MPTVQRYGERKVDVRPMSGQRRTAASTRLSEGVGVAQAEAESGRVIASVGAQATRIGIGTLEARMDQNRREAEQARTRANQLQALAADDSLAQWEIENVHGENGALSKQGEDALGIPEATDAAFEKYADEIAATISEPEVQLSFAKSRQNRRERVALQTRRHTETAIREFQVDKLTAVVKSAVQLAPKYSSDPADGMLAGELARGTQAIRDLGALKGASTEHVDLAVDLFRTDVHESVLRALVADGKMVQARGYFAAVKGGKDEPSEWGDRVDEMQALVKEGSSVALAQQVSDKIIAEGGTLAQQRAKVRAQTTGEDREKAMQLVEHEFTVNDRATKQANEEATTDLNNLADSSRSLRAVMQHPAWKSLSLSERNGMKNYLKDKATDVARKTNQLKWSNRIDMAGSQDPVARQLFLDLDLGKEISFYSDSDFQELKKIQMGLRKGDKATEDKVADARTNTQIIADTLGQRNMSRGTKAGSKMATEFSAVIDRRARAGEKLTDADKQQVADDLVIRYMVHDNWFSNTYTTLADLSYQQLSSATIARVTRDLRIAKVVVTPAAVLEYVKREERRKAE